MTKWFDTNYHYVVPEIDRAGERPRPLPWREPLGDADATWPILGPYSLARLSKLADGLDATEIASAAAAHSGNGYARSRPAFRLQLDEPSLGMALTRRRGASATLPTTRCGHLGIGRRRS